MSINVDGMAELVPEEYIATDGGIRTLLNTVKQDRLTFYIVGEHQINASIIISNRK